MRSVVVVVVLAMLGCGGSGGGTPDARPGSDADVDALTDAMSDGPVGPDAGPTTAQQIAAARASADGAGLTLPITNATVTYVFPAGPTPSTDPAAFTIQAEQTGPALLIAVDPATLSPPPVVGDVVSLTVTELTTVLLQRRAVAITDFTRVSQGADVGALAQNVSNTANLLGGINMYESEIVDAMLEVITSFVTSGTGYVAAQVNTAALQGNVNLTLRVPSDLLASVDLENTCNVTVNNVPYTRVQSSGVVRAHAAGELTLSNCPAPTVVEAVALSATSVRVTFSRHIAAGSVLTNGSQFSFDNGLAASAAAVSGRTVTLTTSAQTGGITYAVSVANTVTDTLGTAVGAPTSAMFSGFVVFAGVKINEIHANVAQGCDLIELRVTSSGSLGNFELHDREGILITFPTMSVAAGDLIVVHVDSTDTTNCNPGTSTNETTSKTQNPMATFAANYDTAYDLFSTDTGLTATDNVLTLFDPADTIVDGVLIDDDTAGANNVSALSETAAAALAAATQWVRVAGGVPTNGFVDDDFRMHAVLDSDNNTAKTGLSLQRIDNTDDNNAADWSASPGLASSFGTLNAGQ